MISQTDKDIIISLMGSNAFGSSKSSTTFSYITNSDGSIRWLYPKDLKKPTFLNFYSTSSIRAKILSYMIKLAFMMKQTHRISAGDIDLTISKESRLGKVLDDYKLSSGFSIFTGTIGENRKAVIEIHDDNNILVFVKIALTDSAKELVKNETMVLNSLEELKFHNLIVPKVLKTLHNDTIVLSNIRPVNAKQHASVRSLHIKALSELYIVGTKQNSIKRLYLLDECKQFIKKLSNDFEVVNTLSKNQINKLKDKTLLLINMLEEKDATIKLSISHGDFTPWNMYESDDKLYLLDWELSKEDIPLLFDLFHFIFQSEIMIKKTEYLGVLTALEKLKKMQEIKSIVEKYNIDLNVNYMLYITYNVLYYLQKYIQQPILHEQVFWQIEVWNSALDDIINKNGKVFDE